MHYWVIALRLKCASVINLTLKLYSNTIWLRSEKPFTCVWRHSGACWESRSSGARHPIAKPPWLPVCIRLICSGHWGPLTLPTAWSVASAAGGLRGLSGSFEVPPDPMARDQGRQWWWPDLVVCTHLTAGAGGVCLCGGRGGPPAHMWWWGPGPAAGLGSRTGTLQLQGSVRRAGAAQGLATGPHTAVEPGDRTWAGSVQVCGCSC